MSKKMYEVYNLKLHKFYQFNLKVYKLKDIHAPQDSINNKQLRKIKI